MAVLIDTPVPSVKTVARMLGVPPQRVKEIERMVDALPSPDRRNLPKRRSPKVHRSVRSRGGRRS